MRNARRPCRKSRLHAGLLALSFFLPCAATADQDPWSILRRYLPQPGAAEFRYEETHTLELMAEPWHGQGYLLSAPDGSLVKLQLTPQRVIMAISGGQMYYYDPGQGQR
ncbi:MAG: outer rane lipoprotein carrier protein LolA, partial [Proteobacteria bacterium]|nr:outer rane lipoprotein carrier protein LolA [Pseudomonadota bacterium]